MLKPEKEGFVSCRLVWDSCVARLGQQYSGRRLSLLKQIAEDYRRVHEANKKRQEMSPILAF